MGIKVSNTVKCYEVNGQKLLGICEDDPKVTVKSHWNDNDMVVIELGDLTVTVLGRHLKKAIDNAMNSGHY